MIYLVEYSVYFVAFAYIMIPWLDEFCSWDSFNPTTEMRKKLEGQDLQFRIPLYLSLALDWMLFFRVMPVVAEL